MGELIYEILCLFPVEPHRALTFLAHAMSVKGQYWPLDYCLQRMATDPVVWIPWPEDDREDLTKFLVLSCAIFEFALLSKVGASDLDQDSIVTLQDIGFIFRSHKKQLPSFANNELAKIMRTVPRNHMPEQDEFSEPPSLCGLLAWQYEATTRVIAQLPTHLHAHLDIVDKSIALHYGLAVSR